MNHSYILRTVDASVWSHDITALILETSTYITCGDLVDDFGENGNVASLIRFLALRRVFLILLHVSSVGP